MVRSQEEPSSIWATSGQFRSTCEARICTMMSFSCITAFSRPGLDLRHGNYRGSPSIQGHGGHTLCIQGDFLAGKRGFTRVHWHKRPRSCWCSLTPKACSRSRHCGTMLIPGRDDRPRHAFGNWKRHRAGLLQRVRAGKPRIKRGSGSIQHVPYVFLVAPLQRRLSGQRSRRSSADRPVAPAGSARRRIRPLIAQTRRWRRRGSRPAPPGRSRRPSRSRSGPTSGPWP